jgi:hypothetical protein
MGGDPRGGILKKGFIRKHAGAATSGCAARCAGGLQKIEKQPHAKTMGRFFRDDRLTCESSFFSLRARSSH